MASVRMRIATNVSIKVNPVVKDGVDFLRPFCMYLNNRSIGKLKILEKNTRKSLGVTPSSTNRVNPEVDLETDRFVDEIRCFDFNKKLIINSLFGVIASG